MSGINSQSVGKLENLLKFNKDSELQHKEFCDGSGLEWEDYGARMQDPHLGVWHKPDPLASKYSSWSPYAYTYDNPIKYIDPNGKEI